MGNTYKRYFGEGGLFAASNSGVGFKSYYDEVFNRAGFERFYIIKGGPGTGKSSFMKSVAKSFKEKGKYVEYYNCSSDPDSVDGVIIEGKIALVDGTSPHVSEAELAGARDEIINLGEFWSSELLGGRRAEISMLSAGKKMAYNKAYSYLSCCKALGDINRSLILPAVNKEKLRGVVSRIFQTIPKGNGYSAVPALSDSVGMKGRVKYDTFEKCAEKLYNVIDHYSSAHILLAEVAEAAKRWETAVRISYDPIDPTRIDGVFLLESGVAFTLNDRSEADICDGTRINMRRFVSSEISDAVKREYRSNRRSIEAHLSSACDAFAEAGKYHFALEEIYSSAMDFSAKESFQRSFCQKLLDNYS